MHSLFTEYRNDLTVDEKQALAHKVARLIHTSQRELGHGRLWISKEDLDKIGLDELWVLVKKRYDEEYGSLNAVALKAQRVASETSRVRLLALCKTFRKKRSLCRTLMRTLIRTLAMTKGQDILQSWAEA